MVTVCDTSEMSFLVHNNQFNKTVNQLYINHFVESVQCLFTRVFFLSCATEETLYKHNAFNFTIVISQYQHTLCSIVWHLYLS